MRKTAIFAVILFSFPLVSQAEPTAVVMESAADHHVASQGHFKGGLKNSWEYNFGTQVTGKNITGAVAWGLLAAHQLTGQDEHQRSALSAARSLIRAYDRGWKNHRPYTQDIEFMVAAGFILDAARWFKVTRERYTPAVYVDQMIQGRRAIPTVVGWDGASAVRAALAVGENGYARGIMDELLRRRGEWDRADRGPGQGLARGSMLWALGELRDRVGLTEQQRRVALSLVRALSSAQQSDGGWREAAGGKLCTQTSAYAILGLSRWGQGRQAVARGQAWLKAQSLIDQRYLQGGDIWATTYHTDGSPENNYNALIQSEVMLALAAKAARR